MGTAPNSFSITAIFWSRCVCNRWFNKVVLPGPRNPVSTVMGILADFGGGPTSRHSGSVRTSATTWYSVISAGKRSEELLVREAAAKHNEILMDLS